MCAVVVDRIALDVVPDDAICAGEARRGNAGAYFGGRRSGRVRRTRTGPCRSLSLVVVSLWQQRCACANARGMREKEKKRNKSGGRVGEARVFRLKLYIGTMVLTLHD